MSPLKEMHRKVGEKYQLGSRIRETRLSGSEEGAGFIPVAHLHHLERIHRQESPRHVQRVRRR